MDANLPKEYTKGKDLARAYMALSKADVYRGRIRRWQHWRFLVYVNTLLTAGVAVSKDEKYKSFIQYKPTMRLLRIWQAKMSMMKKKAISEKIAHGTHTSKKYVLNNFEYYRPLFLSKQFGTEMIHEFEITDDELTWMKK